ncbi:glycoside hydrolase family 2 TIM barrel-domain containing protein [Propionimicrobium sp. PCR01-08-3]|uniref:glycoside hydrolase family 2 protein n=1 Tax=Propionimicrobium sp. PCR01-08-3 TaxID=3052086 RepID=UPI00255C3F4C|nr:glycoside hydrolase family 2 TIM barrel-domain containing protein [Propionimicrobium sp. PCR01-08-3]WIY81828.1 glycoside hydrolase family 2 TIM barrel-domain containing protein [Propionimicrobium sp. PCR01-08-3]
MKPVATELRTPWADEALDAECPLANYPRPQLERSEWCCLNGTWEYAIRPSSVAQLLHERPPESYDGRIRVPFALETVASGVTRELLPSETLFYRRVIEFDEAWTSRRIALNFEAVDYRAAVWANGVLVGEHRGGYLPFSVELPATSEPVEVVVGVRDPGPAGGQQYGKQALSTPKEIWYTPTSGIWQTVWAEPLPANAITSVNTTSYAELGGFSVLVHTEEPCRLEVAVESPDGTQTIAHGRSGRPIEVALPYLRPWTPDDPYLYRVEVSNTDDKVTSWAGLRTVTLGRVKGQRRMDRPVILLNGEPLLLNAPLDQGYWPESGMTAPCDEALIFDLQQMKDLGFNGVRKHVKVESRRFYHHADRLGMLVIQDVVNGGRPRVGIPRSRAVMALDLQTRDRSRRGLIAAGRGSQQNRDEFEADIAGMINVLRGHPSVAMWVIFNEGWGQYHTLRLERMVRKLDDTRLIDSASGWFDQRGGDFRSRHRYVLKLKRPPRRDRRPLLLSEFGGYSLSLEGHLWEGAGRFGYRFFDNSEQLSKALAKLYRDQLIPLAKHGLRGCVYTQVSDVEIETNGLLSYDRKVLKPDAEKLRALNTELYRAFEKALPHR